MDYVFNYTLFYIQLSIHGGHGLIDENSGKFSIKSIYFKENDNRNIVIS